MWFVMLYESNLNADITENSGIIMPTLSSDNAMMLQKSYSSLLILNHSFYSEKWLLFKVFFSTFTVQKESSKHISLF